MAEPSKQANTPSDEEDYRLAPPDPQRIDRDPESDPLIAGRQVAAPPKGPFQFSLTEAFVLMVAVAVFLSVVASLPGGFATGRVAGLLGAVVLVARIVLTVVPPDRAIVHVAWWVTLGLYLLLCVVALAKPG